MSFMYEEYYKQLTETEQKFAPKNLYFEGDFSLLESDRRVSVVGSRKASQNGLKRAMQICKLLVKNNITIVSGLAEGIDTIAHRSALEFNGKTISVLGTSLDITYPKSNYNLLQNIKENHLAISQFPANTPIQKKNFPQRNRTMALVSDATIIIEASENSGTRHQGWEALRLGRSLYILQSVLDNGDISWVNEMIDYGAQLITSENAEYLISEIPYLTCKEEYAF